MSSAAPHRIKRDPPTMADVVVTAVSPLLIMGVVGSLVFFLAEVFYAGKYEGRLLYTLFFFVVGAVMVGRVAVRVDRNRAWAYGGILAVATVFALRMWVEFPEDHPLALFKDVINITLVAVVWWASNRLVWDCTHIDEAKTGSGQGLLAVAGWEKRPAVRPDVVEDAAEDEATYAAGVTGWYQRFDQWRKAGDKQPHTPGLTVVYFAVAAIPMFGLGQAIVPADDAARRNFTFWTMAVYVASTLGLLLTTSFLGLRRYLRQRKLNMPIAMTARWMGLGAVLIVAFVVIGALIPRPYSESPVWNPTRAVTGDRKASQYAQVQSGGAKGEGRAGDQTTKGDGQATGKGGEPGGKGKNGDAKSGSGDKQGNNSSGGEKNGEKNGDKSGDQAGNKSQDGKNSQDIGKQADAKDAAGKDGKDGNAKSGDQSTSSTSKTLAAVANVLKWIVFAVVALVVIFVIFRHGLSFLSNFMPWAKNLLAAIDAWWKGLFGVKESVIGGVGSGPNAPAKVAHVPFSAFSDPFADGTAAGRSVEALIRYSFEALEAWTNDRGDGRRAAETGIEFARRIGEGCPDLATDANRLAVLLARMLYATDELPKNARSQLETFWKSLTQEQEMEAVVVQ